MVDFVSFHDLSQESASIYFKCGPFFIIHLLSCCSFLRPLMGEQYAKMELKYTEGGHCQSVLYPQTIFIHAVLLACYHDITQLLQVRVRVRQTVLEL